MASPVPAAATASTPLPEADPTNVPLTHINQLNIMDEPAFINAYKNNCAFINSHEDHQIKPVLKFKKLKFLRDIKDDLTMEAATLVHEQLTPEPKRMGTKDIIIDRIIYLGRIICTSIENLIDEENYGCADLSLVAETYDNGDIILAE